MSRLDHAPTEMHVEPGPLPAAHAITLQEGNIVRVVEQGHSAELNQLLIDVGTARMATASENFSAIVRISKDAAIKESKTYKSLKGQFSADGGKMNGTWEEYCGMTGRSVDTVDRGIANLKVFGVEALESMMRIGFTRSELNQYRRLPADERTALIEAAKAGDKDGLLDLAETLITRHTKEKEALETRAKEAEDTAAARDDVIKHKESKISQLEVRAASAERRQADFTDIEKRDYECAPLHDTINETMVAMLKMATQVKYLVEEVGGELVTEECFHAVLLPIKRALEIANFNLLHIDLETLFDAEATAATEELQARAAGLPTGALQ